MFVPDQAGSHTAARGILQVELNALYTYLVKRAGNASELPCKISWRPLECLDFLVVLSPELLP